MTPEEAKRTLELRRKNSDLVGSLGPSPRMVRRTKAGLCCWHVRPHGTSKVRPCRNHASGLYDGLGYCSAHLKEWDRMEKEDRETTERLERIASGARS